MFNCNILHPIFLQTMHPRCSFFSGCFELVHFLARQLGDVSVAKLSRRSFRAYFAMRLRIGIVGREDAVPIEVAAPFSLSAIELAVYAACPELCEAKHRLRIIFHGKLLDCAGSLAEAPIKEGSFLHCAVSERVNAESGEEAALLENGDTVVNVGDGTEEDRSRRSERNELEGSAYDWFWGFLLGAVLGVIMLILSLDRSLSLSRRWRRGIGAGVAVHLLVGLVLLLNDKNLTARLSDI